MRAIWKGHIRFSLVTIPVQIFSAINPEETIRFNQLHKEDNGRIAYDKRCKKCDQVVQPADIIKGYEYEKDKYVILEDSDFDNIKQKSAKVIEIEGFVDLSEVTPAYYDSPYFIAPDGEVAAKAYSLLLKTLKDSGKTAVGRVVLRERENVVMLAPNDKSIMMYKLRYPDEIRSETALPNLNGESIDKNQLKLAKTLVDSMTMKFNEIKLEDRYKIALKEIIDAKLKGKKIAVSEEEPAPVADIMSALKQSLEKAKSQRMPMEKAKGKIRKTAASSKKKESKRAKSG